MQWFYTVYNSKYCKESWDTLTDDWSFDKFLEFENQISIQYDIEQGCERDMNHAAAMNKNSNNKI